MLSDRERETLQEIQRRFLVEGPALARSFEPADQLAGRRSPRDRQRARTPSGSSSRWCSARRCWRWDLPGISLMLAAGAGLIAVERRYRDDLWRRGT